MLLLSRNDCLSSSSLPISLRLCSSTHLLTSRASSTCLTRLSAPWFKERGDAEVRSQRREETRRGKEKERKKWTGRRRREKPSPRSLHHSSWGFHFTTSRGKLRRKLACWRSVWLNLHLFDSQDYLALDICRVPEHAQKNPSDSHIQSFPSVYY